MIEPLSHRPIADPVMILQVEDEAAGLESDRVRSPDVTSVDRVGTAEEPTAVDRPGQVRQRATEIAEGPIRVADEVAAQLGVKIIRPEPIESPSPLGFGP